MQMSTSKKISILVVIAICMSIFYLLVGLDFDIFEYQFQSRFKKFILILLVGAAIGTSVVIFQAITTNRLLTPSIMGLDSVYLFVKVLPIFILGEQANVVTNIYLNFLITLIAMVIFSLLLFQVIFKLGHFSVYFILLVGVILGTFFRSITSFLQLIMNPESFLAVQNVMFASFEASNSKLVTVSGILLVILIIVTIILRPYLDVLLLGRAQAINLGVSYENMTRMFLILVALLVSISTALIGPVTFLGLLTVNLAHEFMKTYEHKFILPATILFSWISLFIAQWVVENLFEATTEFSLIVDLVGGSYFIYLLVKRRNAN
ncbi:iron chelate uptake ABC transporter family permease subunit [Staphylococcus epidermidis]|uniref:iron chelate uptake ABC transporter family permease subunit n=1 Tax=Staphylococcus epidermidis TaxID=1282 RepID=UPI00138DE75D|nr:iron chelate uptake ABC transporter family permease subunit [Staphylococcus epidermidis]MCG1509578.1 iron chelate uptake ABC transporter family permease subunit [Staphylococcus epidermidis]MCG1884483.1 iron chelate uptake ABC transporter family permease subunit [Staphylococcus epidermidis]MCG1912807.1 iron chelate uptake ABC transporter family permease subunit [Staphylococcus epidermidis]MCG2563861.1 iron chelate uptake ABC transporter family permease subunit [Staphylococcus epidermidis]